MNNQSDAVAPAPELEASAVGKHCLVTGGAGFVGSVIIRRLLAIGCKVRSFDVAPHDYGPDVEVVTGDIRNYDDVRPALEGIDTVFHTAAIISLVGLCRPSKRRFVFDVNVGGVKNVLRAAREAGTRALMHTSTINTVLDRDLGRIDETQPYATRSKDLYTLTKVAAERAVLEANDPRGLRTCAFRPGGVWGSDIRPVMIHNFLDTLAAGRFRATVGDGKSTFENTHVQNLVDAQLLASVALHKSAEPVGGQAYYITDDEPVNCMGWFRPLVEALDYSFPTMRIPAGVMKQVGLLLEVAHFLGAPEPTMTRRGMRNLDENVVLDISKARRDLGFEPRYNRANGFPPLVPLAREYIASKQTSAT